MNITLTDEQIEYVKTSGKVVLNACPGSGKTTTVAHKLYSLIQNRGSDFPNNAGFACLSFTNVAKNEISEKFREINGLSLPYPHLISTIDSFVNSYITLPFVHKVLDSRIRYCIVDDMEYLDERCRSYYKLIHDFKSVIYRYAPSNIDYTIDGGISWNGTDKSNDTDFVKYGEVIKKYQFSLGLLKTSDSAYFAFQILKQYPRLAKYIAAKFPYLIIDEAQDTSEIQHSILEMLYNEGLKNIDLVGDPYQCLYQWRDASPELFLKKFKDTTNWKGLYLTENRRSSKKIIDVINVMRRKSDKAILPVINNKSDLPLHIIKYDYTSYASAIKNYEMLCLRNKFTDNRIIVRGNTLKNKLLGKKNDCSPWNTPLPFLIIESKIHFQSNEIKEAIKMVRRIVIELLNPKSSYLDLKEIELERRNNKEGNVQIFNFLRDLPSFDLSIKDWTIQTQQYLKDQLSLATEPNFKIRVKNTTNFDKIILDNSVNSCFKKSTTDNNIPVTTIHQVKGMTFDSVFLLLSEDSKGQNISLHDFEIREEILTEKQRLIYVAISRPRGLLCIGVPNTVTDKELKQKFIFDFVII